MSAAAIERLRARIAARIRHAIGDEPPDRRESGPARRAAVLVLIVGQTAPLHLVLFERTLDVAEHKGEICFPGGSIEEGDADAISAALREAHEELGIPPREVTVFGCLDDVHTARSNYVITPVVGAIDILPTLILDPVEVARPLVLSLDRLSAPDAWKVESIDVGGAVRDLEAHRIGDARIWGATARILRSFLELWKTE